MDDKNGIGKIVNMLNNLGKPSMSQHPPNCSCCSNIPPPGSPPRYHYPHHGHPHHRGHHHHGQYPGPPSPPRHHGRGHHGHHGHGHHGHRHHGTKHISHFGPGPHGPGICPPQCGYGWHPPPHCTGSFSWVEGQHGTVPHNAVKVGVDKDGGHIYAGRAFHEGDLLPAKVVPSHGGAFVPWGGREHTKYEYEVLCSAHVGWTSAEGGEIPPEAISVGQTSDGEKLYLGRVMHEGTLTPGKIQPSHGVLYIPYGGLEISFTEYEVMVLL